jgi:hypothetical protein
MATPCEIIGGGAHMRGERFPCLARCLCRIEPDLSYPSAWAQPCHHSAGEHNASSIPIRKRQEVAWYVLQKEERSHEDAKDRMRTSLKGTINLKFSVHAPHPHPGHFRPHICTLADYLGQITPKNYSFYYIT